MSHRLKHHFALATAPVIAGLSIEELGEQLQDAAVELNTAADQLTENQDSIETLQDELESAQVLQAAVESLQGSSSPAAHRAVGMLLDHHLQRFEITLPSLESDATAEEQTSAKAEAHKGIVARAMALLKQLLERVGAFLKNLALKVRAVFDRRKPLAAKAKEELEAKAKSGEAQVSIRIPSYVRDSMIDGHTIKTNAASDHALYNRLLESIHAIGDDIGAGLRAEGKFDTFAFTALLKSHGAFAQIITGLPEHDGMHVFEFKKGKRGVLDLEFKMATPPEIAPVNMAALRSWSSHLRCQLAALPNHEMVEVQIPVNDAIAYCGMLASAEDDISRDIERHSKNAEEIKRAIPDATDPGDDGNDAKVTYANLVRLQMQFYQASSLGKARSAQMDMALLHALQQAVGRRAAGEGV